MQVKTPAWLWLWAVAMHAKKGTQEPVGQMLHANAITMQSIAANKEGNLKASMMLR